MNTYVMGEIATLLAVTVLAGILIGWCIKSLFTGRTERKVRAHVARDVDDAAADVSNIRQALMRKEAQLKDATQELQKMRGRDISLKAGNTNQIDEINKLKNELALARQSLDRNRTEFNAFRNEKQSEIQNLGNKLSAFQSGGSIHDERMQESNETVSALRTAVRENDKVIDSLRARIKEGDTSVENLRNQLRSAETSLTDIRQTKQSDEATLAKLNTDLQKTRKESETFKRDYETMLENKNKEIARLQQKQQELGNVQTVLQQKEHEYNKLNQDSRENANRFGTQLADLKRTISEKEARQAEATKNLRRMQDQINALETKNRTLVASTEKQSAIAKQLENKSAEVVALNDMLKDVSTKRTQAANRATELENQLKTAQSGNTVAVEAQRKLEATTAMLQERDATISKLRADMEDIIDSRNKVSIELGELQTNSEKTRLALTQQSEQQITQMRSALQDRDKSFEKLRSDMDQMVGTRDRLTQELAKLQQHGSQLETFKTDMQSTVEKRESELQQRKASYEKLQQEFNQLANKRDDYEKRISALTAEVNTLTQKLQSQEQQSTLEITQLQPQLAEMRSRLSLADSENQKLSADLANVASLKLALTERDSTIHKLTVDLQDAKMTSASGAAHDDAIGKVNSLTSALKDRDDEISRLNTIVTDNRLGSQKYQSEIALLQQEVESQGNLIKGLEEQAENTLQLHKKIAAQSTEIEDLRASLYQNDAAPVSATSAVDSNSQALAALKTQLQQQNNETATLRNKLVQTQQSLSVAEEKLRQPASHELQLQQEQLKRQIEQRDWELKNVRKQLAEVTRSNATPTESKATRVTGNSPRPATPAGAAKDNATKSATKPRVFVRQKSTVSDTEALTGATAYNTSATRAAYTRDGYKIQRLDGGDDLTLLPGINARAQQELNNNGVSDFEQIALWGKREIAHFSERAGISIRDAENYNWPKLASQILEGNFRKSSFKEKDNS